MIGAPIVIVGITRGLLDHFNKDKLLTRDWMLITCAVFVLGLVIFAIGANQPRPPKPWFYPAATK